MSNISKALKGMPAYLEKVEGIKLGKTPIDYLMINVPPLCNYRCKKCFTSASSRKIKDSLTLKEVYCLIKEGKKLGTKVVCILGEGEPLVYKYIKETIAYIHKQKSIPLIATNARMLSQKMTDFLYKHNVTVVVSLDTLDQKEYSEFCGGNADLNKVLDNLEYARKKYSKSIKIKKGIKVYQLGVHMTVTAKNYKHLIDIEKFCGEDIYFDCQPLANVGDAEKNPSYVGKKDTYEYYQAMSEEIYPPMVLAKTVGGKYCGLFNYGLAVGYEGEVMFDTHAIDSKVIGNIRDLPLEILFKKAKEYRMLFKEKYATGYCPVRDRNYKKFLAFLRKQKKVSRTVN